MAGPGTRVAPLFMLGGGVILLWSGITGRKVTAVLKDIIQGKNPALETPVNLIGPTVTSSFGPTAGYGGGPGPTGAKLGTLSGGSNITGTAWSQALLKALGAPLTNANIVSLNAWQAREGGGGANNPLNTTLNCCGGTNLAGNPAGVKNYPTTADGLQATVSTLHGYPLIFMSLMAGRGLCGGGYAGEFLTWSGNGYASVC